MHQRAAVEAPGWGVIQPLGQGGTSYRRTLKISTSREIGVTKKHNRLHDVG
jgi:hypothetical protein